MRRCDQTHWRMEVRIGEPGGIAFVLTAQHWRFYEKNTNDKPGVEFGRLPLNETAPTPGEDLLKGYIISLIGPYRNKFLQNELNGLRRS